jgi:cyclopropane-fatty-acyl-phospholipid synthase
MTAAHQSTASNAPHPPNLSATQSLSDPLTPPVRFSGKQIHKPDLIQQSTRWLLDGWLSRVGWAEQAVHQLSQKLVCQAFGRMPVGHLQMTLPSGQVITFGHDAHQPPVPMVVYHSRFFTQCLLYGPIGFAEAYVEGLMDLPDIAGAIGWFIANQEHSTVFDGSPHQVWWLDLLGTINRWQHRLRSNSLINSRANIHAHYDLSNAFFALFLDPTLTYSSARFSDPNMTLEAAQLAKYQALCDRLQLTATDRVLEIGTGWGGFARYAAQTTGCHVTTVTISQEQYDVAVARIAQAGLSDRVDVRLMDYRLLVSDPSISRPFDKVVSIEMIEAVGDDYLDTFLATCDVLLKPQGLMALQMITCPDSRYTTFKTTVDFIQKHIFPGSLLPSIERVAQGFRRHVRLAPGLVSSGALQLHHLEDMGQSYAKTLNLWHQAFNAHLPSVMDLGFDAAFIRKWNYYLQYCQAAFATRHITVVQALYTRPNNPNLAALVS